MSRVCGSAIAALAYLGLGENEKAINALMGALTDYREADRAIDELLTLNVKGGF